MASAVSSEVGWRIGGHVLKADGTFWAGGTFIGLTPLQRRLMVCFCSRAGELISRDELAAEAWNTPKVSDQSLARAIHCLRRVLDDCGLGGDLIATLYGSGYTFTAVVEPLQEGATQAADSAEVNVDLSDSHIFADRRALAQEHHIEARILFRRRHPGLLPQVLQHLNCALDLDPAAGPVLVDACWLHLHRASWGLAESSSCSAEIRTLLQQIEQLQLNPEGLDCIRAERLSLLEWRPADGERIYASALAGRLQRGDALLSWVRHLVATGRSRQALDLITPHLHEALPLGWLLAAMAHLNLGLNEEALACLDRQLAIDSSLVSTHLFSGLIRAYLGLQDQAMRHLAAARRFTGSDNTYLDLHPLVAYVMAHGDDRAQAQAMLNKACHHEDLPLPSLWALAALALDDPAAAGTWFDRALKRRCFQAPFLLHSAVLVRYNERPVVRRFREAMLQAFPEPVLVK